jgi:hypothetical protein
VAITWFRHVTTPVGTLTCPRGHPLQVGETAFCPTCVSSLTDPAPPTRRQSLPLDVLSGVQLLSGVLVVASTFLIWVDDIGPVPQTWDAFHFGGSVSRFGIPQPTPSVWLGPSIVLSGAVIIVVALIMTIRRPSTRRRRSLGLLVLPVVVGIGSFAYVLFHVVSLKHAANTFNLSNGGEDEFETTGIGLVWCAVGSALAMLTGVTYGLRARRLSRGIGPETKRQLE